MYKKSITYTDYNGVKRTEDFYFNISKGEMAEMELTCPGGYADKLRRIADSNDMVSIFETFKEILLKAYGRKSDDGKRFIKSEEISKEFEQSEAYSELIFELAGDGGKGITDFVVGVMPDTGMNSEELLDKTKALIESKKDDEAAKA